MVFTLDEERSNRTRATVEHNIALICPLSPTPIQPYLNNLPPADAKGFEVARNLLLAVLGASFSYLRLYLSVKPSSSQVAIWDILQYIHDDIGVLGQSTTISVVLISFLTSRLFATAFILLSIIGRTHSIGDCNGAWSRGAGISCSLAHLTASYIFLQRLWAVYTLNRGVKIVFFVIWVTANGLMTTTIYGAQFGHIPDTGYCTYVEVHPYVSIAGFSLAFFDTAVFVATSYKISVSHSEPSIGISWDTVISRRALPGLSRAVLQGGQQYFLITICSSIPVAILIVVPIIPPTYKEMLPYPLAIIAPSMACRVFRNLKLHLLPGFELDSSAVVFKENPSGLSSDLQELHISPSEPSVPKSPSVPEVQYI